MNLTIKIITILILIFLFSNTGLKAQKGWEVGGGLGTALYLGDLNTEFRLNELGYVVSGVVRYNYNTRISLKFPLSYGMVRGSDIYSSNPFEKARNLSFRSSIWELGSQLEFNFFNYEHGSANENFTPYLFAGLSIYRFNPKTEYEGNWVELRPLGTEGQRRGEEYAIMSPAFIFGGGLKFDVSFLWSLNLELSGRLLFNDYLDDVSTTYPNPDQIRANNGELAVILSDRSDPMSRENFNLGVDGVQRGNGKNNDSFNFFTLNIMYYFARVECPKRREF